MCKYFLPNTIEIVSFFAIFVFDSFFFLFVYHRYWSCVRCPNLTRVLLDNNSIMLVRHTLLPWAPGPPPLGMTDPVSLWCRLLSILLTAVNSLFSTPLQISGEGKYVVFFFFPLGYYLFKRSFGWFPSAFLEPNLLVYLSFQEIYP